MADAQDRIITFILNKRQENCGESKERGTIYNLWAILMEEL